jgi:hypothetical protein
MPDGWVTDHRDRDYGGRLSDWFDRGRRLIHVNAPEYPVEESYYFSRIRDGVAYVLIVVGSLEATVDKPAFSTVREAEGH